MIANILRSLPTIWWGRLHETLTGGYEAFLAESSVVDVKRVTKFEDAVSGPLWSATLSDAQILSNGRLVALSNGSIITGIQSLQGVLDPKQSRTCRRLRILRKSSIKGRALMLGAPCGNNYYHWLYDCLPRLKIAEAAGNNLKNIDHFLVDVEANTSLVAETLRLLEIDPAKVHYLHKRTLLTCESLVLPSMPVSISGTVTTHWVNWLRDTLGKHCSGFAPRKTGRRIFIARENQTSRKLLNSREIQWALEGVGFETHYLSGQTVRDQSSLFNTADLVVAQHGAGLTNLTFCRSGTGVLEIMSPGHANKCYAQLSTLCDLRRAQIIGNPGSATNGVNITVDPLEVLEVVKILSDRVSY